MTQVVDDGFAVQDLQTTVKEFQTEAQKPDELWVTRLTPIPVGQSFTVNRPEGESVRQFKKRINRAAMAPPNFKTLEWKSRDTNLPEGVEPTHFVVKIRALDLKAKAEHEAKLQNPQNGIQEAAQTTNGTGSAQDSPQTEETAQPRVRGR
jgi:hypothetical protein